MNARTLLAFGASFMLLAPLVGCGAGPQKKPKKVEAPPPVPTPAPKVVAPPPLPPPPTLTDEEKRALVEAGRQASLDGDLSMAERRFRDAADMAPDLVEARYNLGVLAEWQGRYAEARRQYERALAKEPEFAAAVVAIGRLMMRTGGTDAALDFARDTLADRPQSIPLRNALNRLRVAARRELGAVESESKLVLREDEKNVEAMVNLATAFHHGKKYELAIAILQNAKVLDEEDPEIQSRIALAHLGLGEELQARIALEAASQLEGGATAEVYNNLGLLYHQAGDYASAELQFRKALARWPDMLSARINLGNALKGQQRYIDADQELQTALRTHPESPELLFNLGILYLDGSLRGVDAIDRLQQALKFFERYKQVAGLRPPDDPTDAYIGETNKRIVVEQKKAEQQRKSSKPAPGPEEEAPSDEVTQ